MYKTKIKVDHVDKVLEILRSSGIRIQTENVEDTYLDNGSIFDNHHYLYIRRATQTTVPCAYAQLIYVAPSEFDSMLKQKREGCTSISSPDMLQQILKNLNVVPWMIINSRRTTFRLEHCDVSIVIVDNAGTFVEIFADTASEAVIAIELLGLNPNAVEDRMYPDLLTV